MSGHLLRWAAVLLLAVGALAALFLPITNLDVCSRISFVSCSSQGEVLARVLVAIAGGVGAAVLYGLGHLRRR